MNISGKTIWQQAAGDTDRDYADICLKWGVILNGPGYAGPWPACKKPLLDDDWTQRKMTGLERFAVEMKPGDIVVLRLGTAKVLGVGEVVGDYEWADQFGDIDGWDLQHIRRVRWFWDGRPAPKTFGTYAMKLGDTTQRLNDGPVMKWLSELQVPKTAAREALPKLPSVDASSEISVERVSEFLFDHGVASGSITNLLKEIGELTRIAKWYARSGEESDKPSEHETVAYLVVPLLRALGWTPQKMAVEWKHVDVALFEQLPRSDGSLRVVVEAKRMGDSCLTAVSQAQSYAEGKSACHRLIVTDGLRYGVYVRRKLGNFQLYAYLNLARLRHDYPIYGCHGAEDALLAMAPEWRLDEMSSSR